MATQISNNSVTFRDAKGYTWVMRYHISYDDTSPTTRGNGVSVAENVVGALNGTGSGTLPLTNGHLLRSDGLFGQRYTQGYGTAAQYLNAEDKLMVAFLDTGQQMHRFGIGAPVIAAFLADQETGKASQLVDFVAAMTTAVSAAFVCTPNGLALTAAVGSVLVRRRQRRKTTLISKSSNLDEPGE
jgi:hypothetical protein